jgi:SNF2 family DNA or RNA helicase
METKKIYQEFLEQRLQSGANSGFEPLWIPDYLFDFQKFMTEWAIRKGRAALFEDCGLGKTPQQLVWAENVARKTDKPVLILAPLAVSYQTEREAHKFHIDAKRSHGEKVNSRIVITNYEKLCHFNHLDYGGVVCDESSILKSFDGARRNEITDFMRKVPYRLLATATAAPNDYVELGTSSEALGYLGHIDMLNRFFKNEQGNSNTTHRRFGEAVKWRFKGHAELPFWRWVTSWARACRRPCDLGFENNGFELTKLIENESMVEPMSPADGYLFTLPAMNLFEQRAEKKRTIKERCERVLSIIEKNGEQSIIWCQLNDEGDYLEEIIPDAIQIKGGDKDDKKEGAFIDFADGNIKTLITKPKIGAWGMNWQNCHHVIYFPSHSYEQYYQAVRRCWRFGQKKDVIVDIVLTEGERAIMRNLHHKNLAAIKMFDNLVAEMNNSLHLQKQNDYTKKEEFPEWLLKRG